MFKFNAYRTSQIGRTPIESTHVSFQLEVLYIYVNVHILLCPNLMADVKSAGRGNKKA